MLKHWFKKKTVADTVSSPSPQDAFAGEIASWLERAGQDELGGDLESAEACYRKVLEIDPAHVDANFGLGLLKKRLGEFAEAIDCFGKAVDRDPTHAEAYYHLGTVYQAADRDEDAVDAYGMAVYYRPDHADANTGLIKLHKDKGNWTDVLACCKAWVERCPGCAAAHLHYADFYTKTEDFENASEEFRLALELEPDWVKALTGLGYARLMLDDNEAAAEILERALSAQPGNFSAQVNLACAYRHLGQFDRALALFDRVLKHQPNEFWARITRAQTLLALKRFEEGWLDYEARFQTEPTRFRTLPFPLWKGEPLDGKTLFVYAEQGLGDEIMFASCLPDVIARVGHCVIECDSRLEKLFRRSFPSASVFAGHREDVPSWLDRAPPIDLKIPIGSLGRYFRNRIEDFPDHRGYLKADPERIAYWKARLNDLGPGLKIGFSWRGGTRKTRTQVRTLALEQWVPVFRQSGCQFVNLQYGNGAGDVEELKSAHGLGNVHHWQEAIDDYDETAALVSGLDLVVTVCTAIVHLSGALGVPVWVLTPSVPEWRYMQSGEAMPWYPSSRLFRQTEAGNWPPVLERVQRELDCLRNF